MSISTPPQGTHFSDGVRVGPILGSSFTAWENVFAPSVVVPSPIDQLPPGIYDTPMSLLDITPFQAIANSIADDYIVPAAGYVPIVTTSGNGLLVVTFQSIPNVIQLDCARVLAFTGGAGTLFHNFTIFGWDQYGIPMVESVSGPTGVDQTFGKKAFLYIRAIYADGGTVGTISIGTGDVFGLPYLINFENYIMAPIWNGSVDNGTRVAGDQRPAQIDTGDVRGTYDPSNGSDGAKRLTINLYNGSGDIRNYNNSNSGNRLLPFEPLTTLNGSAVIRVHAPNHQMVENEKVTISGAINFNGILASQLNITAPVSVINGDTFTYQSNGVANFSDAGGGGSVFMTPGNGRLYQTTVGRFGVSQFNMPLI